MSAITHNPTLSLALPTPLHRKQATRPFHAQVQVNIAPPTRTAAVRISEIAVLQVRARPTGANLVALERIRLAVVRALLGAAVAGLGAGLSGRLALGVDRGGEEDGCFGAVAALFVVADGDGDACEGYGLDGASLGM